MPITDTESDIITAVAISLIGTRRSGSALLKGI
ncbi:hypothetical protein SDC9_154443 [bioreactor metagenome]|uniref:Uncharacterized protein n=1 Tax=bioreactor metagenome TaxID=1076179 RepID=A0A645EZ11_9ZZZZ